MCIFCAAVPATAALGAAASANQRKADDATETTVNRAAKALKSVPAGKTTAVVVAGLLTASVVYHSQIGPA
jgi:hypothetical protein